MMYLNSQSKIWVKRKKDGEIGLIIYSIKNRKRLRVCWVRLNRAEEEIEESEVEIISSGVSMTYEKAVEFDNVLLKRRNSPKV